MNQIKIEHVGKKIGEQTILENINLNIVSGKIYGLIGRNGSGKTVLLKCIAGFMNVSEGKILVNKKEMGKDITFLDNMGFILNQPGFIEEASGFKNLQYLASIRKIADKKRIEEVMQMVGLDAKSRKAVEKYSLGMRQKLGIAQAIMENPEILILDEPMNALDEDTVELMRKLLMQWKEQGKLIIITSHNKEDVALLCDEVYRLRSGKIASEKE